MDANERLRHGQSHEARNELPAALACYDATIALLAPLPGGPERQRALALAWMNRGNALQKLRSRGASHHALCAYARARALLAPLAAAAPGDHALRNSLGVTHLNGARVLLALAKPVVALAAADRAIATLALLPLEENISYRANLAGAHLNRASALLPADLPSARAAAHAALGLTARAAQHHLPAAHAALGARCTLLALVGLELSAGSAPGFAPARLLAEAGDLIDDGLALARAWDACRVTAFRPAAAQLFHAGAVLYAAHQPHFLAEFLAENQSLARELPAVVQATLARARRTAHERCLVAGSAEPLSRTFGTLAELSAIAGCPAAPGPAAKPALP